MVWPHSIRSHDSLRPHRAAAPTSLLLWTQYFQQTRIPHRKAPELRERAARGENVHWAFRKPPPLPPFKKEASAMRDGILEALERIREKERLQAEEEERLRREAKGRKRGGGKGKK